MTALDHKIACRQALLLLISEINAEDWSAAEVAAREVQHQAKLAQLNEFVLQPASGLTDGSN